MVDNGPAEYLPRKQRWENVHRKNEILHPYGMTGHSSLENQFQPQIHLKKPQERGVKRGLSVLRTIDACDVLIADGTPFRSPSAASTVYAQMGYAFGKKKLISYYSNNGTTFNKRLVQYYRANPLDGTETVLENFNLFDNAMGPYAVDESTGIAVCKDVKPKNEYTDLKNFYQVARQLYEYCNDNWLLIEEARHYKVPLRPLLGTIEKPKVFESAPSILHANGIDILARKKRNTEDWGFFSSSCLDKDLYTRIKFKGEDEGRALGMLAAMVIPEQDIVYGEDTPLRGPDNDPGEAFEVGFGYALGMPIALYSNTDLTTNARVKKYYQTRDCDGTVIENYGFYGNYLQATMAMMTTGVYMTGRVPAGDELTDLSVHERGLVALKKWHNGQRYSI